MLSAPGVERVAAGPRFAAVTAMQDAVMRFNHRRRPIEKIAVLLDMRGEPQRVLARQALGQFRVARVPAPR